MAIKRKYIRIDIEKGKPSYITYPFGEGAELSKRASSAVRDAHSWLSGGYAPEERTAKTNEHMLRLLNDIEDKVFSGLSKNPFEKLVTIEEVNRKQDQMNEDLNNEAGILLAELLKEHRNKLKRNRKKI